MTEDQQVKILSVIEERIEDIKDKMVLLSEKRMEGIITWVEYEKEREILAKARTSLELEKKLLT